MEQKKTKTLARRTAKYWSGAWQNLLFDTDGRKQDRKTDKSPEKRT